MPTTEPTRSLSEIKEQVKDRADLVGIIGRHTKLVKNGPKFKGCCPFHKEKTPSFYVNPQEGFFFCFGCKAGGDVFTFLEKMEGLSFMEALRDLAEQLHIEIPKQSRVSMESHREAASERATGYEFLDRALKFYHRVLTSEATPGAAQALAYLRKRGIADEEISELGLGWAPENGSELIKKIKSDEERTLAERTGLIRNGERGYYEFFRGRMLIPIRDSKARVCGFSGRILRDEPGQPKYKNSSETDWFKKKEILYGLDRAQKLIREHDFVCIVEGYFDQWAFHRAGIPAVAAMGTALSDEQIKMLGRHTKRAVLVMDADSAGVESTRRFIPAFLQAEWSVAVFGELAGKDPDEWLAQETFDLARLKEKLLSAPEALEWWSKLVLNESLEKRLSRLDIFKNLVEPWRLARTKAHKSILADEISRIMGITPNDVSISLNELAAGREDTAARSAPLLTDRRPVASGVGLETMRKSSSVEDAIVQWIRYWNLLTPQTEEEWADRVVLFGRTPAEAAVRELFQFASTQGWNLSDRSPSEWLARLESEPEVRSWVQMGLVLRDGPEDLVDKDKELISFKETCSFLNRTRVHGDIARLQSELRRMSPGSSEAMKILQKVHELRLGLDKAK